MGALFCKSHSTKSYANGRQARRMTLVSAKSQGRSDRAQGIEVFGTSTLGTELKQTSDPAPEESTYDEQVPSWQRARRAVSSWPWEPWWCDHR